MMKSSVEIRTATAEDFDIFRNLSKESGRYHEDLDDRFRYVLSPEADDARKDWFTKQCTSDRFWIGLAFQDEKLVGYIEAAIQERPPIFAVRNIGFIQDLFIASESRGHGIGSQLWSKALKWLKENDITQIRLWVAVKNSLAQEFWEKKGFGELTRTMELYLE